ncbi:MAG TPA: tyrosine-type recombinase/integrase [Acidobacteriota bacterium]|nr:tyrosine-type recombinase/integrase [Acidobacteriota bacterium]
MATRNLTDKTLKTLKTDKPQEDFWDSGFSLKGGSFGVRVSKDGRKTFLVRYTVHGKKKRAKVGTYPPMKLAKARQEAAKKIGDDKEAERTGGTFERLSKEFMERYAKKQKREKSWQEDQRMLDAYVLPEWKHRKYSTILKRDVLRLLEQVADGKNGKPAPVMANRVLALVSKVFNFAIENDLAPEGFANPCYRVKMNPETSRERVLTDEEIKTFWTTLTARKDISSRVYLLILLTAQRGGEVKAMRWDQVDEEGIWTLPAEITKNKQEHKVPLSTQARALLEEIRETTGDQEWVFPRMGHGTAASKENKNDHVRWFGKKNSRLQKALKFDFTPHDLRRTAATKMSELGIEDTLIARVLNHRWADRQVTSVYNRWKKLPEMKTALERWGARLDQIVTSEPARVVRMR